MEPLLQLRPFCAQSAPALRVEAGADCLRQAAMPPQLQLRYRISAIADLLLPAPKAQGQRRDELWQHTCLEAFVAAPGGEPYWEFNLSPAGDWNIYRLTGYRHGLQPEAGYGELPFTVRRELLGQPAAAAAALIVELCCPLPAPLSEASELELGLTAVLEQSGGALSYWALEHPAAEPDFHDRRGWTLRR